MKIQCSACEVAEAAVFCCADEAALCSDCDRNVHAANKLASKHERVPLANSSSQMPNCDICQEMIGYFFCLEDRALMCRKCDIAIHTANPNVLSHQRFLLTGVRIRLEPSEPSPSYSMGMSTHSSLYNKMMLVKSEVGNLTPAKRSAPMPLTKGNTKVPPVQGGVVWEDTQSRSLYVGDTAGGCFQQWLIDDLEELGKFNHVFEYSDHGSSKADNDKLGISVSSSIAKASEDKLNHDKCLSQEPDIAWSVPQAPSPAPPTTSGLYCTKTSHESMDNSAFVPDIS